MRIDVKSFIIKLSILPVFLLCPLLVFGVQNNNLNELNKSFNQSLQSVVKNARLKYKLPALSVSIHLPGEPFIRDYTAGYYSLSKQRKITPNTLFQIGSITKTYVAVLIMKLAEDGKLALHDKLKSLLPEYKKWGDVSVENLLHHNSGVFNYIDAKYFWNNFKKHPKKHWTLKKLADLAYKYPDQFKPGKGYQYTNTDYILLGLVIEKVTHKDMISALNDYLLNSRNYNLTNTYYAALKYPNETYSHLARGYDDEGTFGYNKDITDYSLSFASSAGAMISSPSDIIKFLLQLFSGRIVSENTLDRMENLLLPNGDMISNIQDIKTRNKFLKKPWGQIGQGIGFGLVYFKDSGYAWMHAGGVNGYQSLYGYNPCDGVMVALAYSKQPKDNFIFLKVYQYIMQRINSTKYAKDLVSVYRGQGKQPVFCRK